MTSNATPRPVPVPEFLKQLPEYEEVWYVDLAEWELDGDAALVGVGFLQIATHRSEEGFPLTTIGL